MKIIRKVIKLFRIPLNDSITFVEALTLNLFYRVLILSVPMKYYSNHIGIQGVATTENKLVFDKKLKTVLRASRRAFRESLWNNKCFDKALTVKRMLKRRGIQTTIYFGLNKKENNLMKAHAWLRCGNKIIVGRAGMKKFTIVSFFS